MPTIETVIQSLYGLPCWNVTWDRTTNLGLHFGQPSLVIQEPKKTHASSPKVRELFSYRQVTVTGEWFLWILHAYWKVTLRDGTYATTTSSERKKARILNFLDGQRLSGFSISAHTGATTFSFDLGGHLQIRRELSNVDCDMWNLYLPNNYLLSIRGDGFMAYHPDNHPANWERIGNSIIAVAGSISRTSEEDDF